ncbi:MAG: hypothetical protein LKE37_10220 [Atopobiaceae bacterium]|jgi:hypothetical protein|nr:hypothetical protein [Atopobiaceae bacterium]
MGSFEDQMRQREALDEELFEDSFLNLASVVMGRRAIARNRDEKIQLKSALDDILKFYHIKPQPIPESMTELTEQLEFLTQSSGVMRRTVFLTDTWQDESVGPYLAFKQTGEAVALLPDGTRGFAYLDHATGRRVRVTKAGAKDFAREAICFYKPFPARSMGRRDLLRFMHAALLPSDVGRIGLLLLITALAGVVTIYFSEFLIWQTIKPEAYVSFVYLVTMIGLSMTLSVILKAIGRYLLQRAKTRVGASVQAALMMRVLTLPADFFRRFSSGELASRATYINTFCDTVLDTFLSAVPMFLLTMLYLLYLLVSEPELVPYVLVEVALTLLLALACMHAKKANLVRKLQASSTSSGVSHTLITGIQKVRVAGAEKRAFAKWAASYQRSAEAAYNTPVLSKASSFIPTVVPLFFCLVYYCVAAYYHNPGGEYYTFTLIYGAIDAALVTLFSQLMKLAESSAAFELAKPIFEAEPEISQQKRDYEAERQDRGEPRLVSIRQGHAVSVPRPLDQDQSRRVRCRRRQVWMRQVDAAAAAARLRVPGEGCRLLRRPGPLQDRPRIAQAQNRHGHAGRKALPGGHLLQHHHLRPLAHRRRRVGGGRDGGHRRRHPSHADGNADPHLRGPERHLRRAAAASRHRPGDCPEAEDPAPGRGDVGPGQRDAAAGRGLVGVSSLHEDRHRPPPLDGAGLRPDPRARRGQDRRGGDLRGAHRARRALRRARLQAASSATRAGGGAPARDA